mmetsp:Transcript_36090/g.78836  ORF Transcript_36090/g.78836 Transcript_36090/m.78836 type:complete len:116 (+) Transcript_36090:224-571(+)
MELSDGQAWTSLDTGVALSPGYAGLWTPEEHQHKIRAGDIDLIAKPGVKEIIIGKGMVGGGVAQLMPDAVDRINELEDAGVASVVDNTPTAAEEYNAKLQSEPAGTVAALFHTGC